MSIIEKLVKIINEGDTNGAKEVMHDDFKFLMHSSGKTLSKDDVVKWIGMKDVKLDKHRILLKIMKLDLCTPLQVIMMVIKKQLCLITSLKMEK